MPKIAHAQITGRVLYQGEPAKICSVELHNQSDDIVDTVLGEDEGRYTFNLSPGTWTLRAWDVYGHRGEVTVELRAGADREVDIELET